VVAFINYLGDFNEPLSPFVDDDMNKEDPPEVFTRQMRTIPELQVRPQ